jgi:hypothetical protein
VSEDTDLLAARARHPRSPALRVSLVSVVLALTHSGAASASWPRVASASPIIVAVIRSVTAGAANRLRALSKPLRHGDVRRLWAAQLTSELGDWAARLAIGVLIFQRTQSPTAVGIAVAASMLGWFGPGQVLVSLTERFPRRQVMVTADLVRVAAYLLVLVPAPVPVLILIVALAGCATPPFEAARSALRPELTPPELLSATITVTQLTSDFSMLVGYLFGGVAIAVLGPYAALSANTASFAISACLTARLPTVERHRFASPRPLRLAAHLLTHAPPLRRALVLVLVSQAGSAGCEALAVPYAERVIGHDGSWAAVLFAAAAVSCLAVTAALPLSGSPIRLLTRCGWLCAAGGAATVVAFAWLPPGDGLIPFAAAGLLMVALVPANVVVGPALPNHLRASAFSLLAGTTVTVQAAGAALAGVIASATSIPSAGALIAAPSLLMGLYAMTRPVPAWPSDGQGTLIQEAGVDAAGMVTPG